jgi:predicted proteasome-type protease
MHPINVDTPTNLVKVLVLSISEAKHRKPKIIQPLAFLIPLEPNQKKKKQSISSTKDSCTSASKKVHLYSNL